MTAAVDVTGAVTAINEAISAIAAVSVAVLTVMAALHVHRWVRGALDDYSSAGDLDCPECGGYMMLSDDPEVGDIYCTDCGFSDDYDPDFVVLECHQCGFNTVDDAELFQDPDTGEPDDFDVCPQCDGTLYRG